MIIVLHPVAVKAALDTYFYFDEQTRARRASKRKEFKESLQQAKRVFATLRLAPNLSKKGKQSQKPFFEDSRLDLGVQQLSCVILLDSDEMRTVLHPRMQALRGHSLSATASPAGKNFADQRRANAFLMHIKDLELATTSMKLTQVFIKSVSMQFVAQMNLAADRDYVSSSHRRINIIIQPNVYITLNLATPQKRQLIVQLGLKTGKFEGFFNSEVVYFLRKLQTVHDRRHHVDIRQRRVSTVSTISIAGRRHYPQNIDCPGKDGGWWRKSRAIPRSRQPDAHA